MRLLSFLKISGMILALAGIICAMQYLNSQDFAERSHAPDSALSVLLGSNIKPSNWCPEHLKSLQLFSSDPNRSATKELTKAQDQAQLCEVMMEAVSKDDLEESFRPIVQAFTKEGEVVTLERNGKGVFRFSGMPFRSSSLEKTLKRYDF